MKKQVDKIILVLFGIQEINMLIPKKRGKGYLKQPLGHYNCPLAALSRDIGFDFNGLDGYLEIQTGYLTDKDKVDLTQRVVVPISNFYDYKWQEVDRNTFFETLKGNIARVDK
ncbi:hypothetical protein ACV0OF_003836 [Acinetobacter baumannii]